MVWFELTPIFSSKLTDELVIEVLGVKNIVSSGRYSNVLGAKNKKNNLS